MCVSALVVHGISARKRENTKTRKWPGKRENAKTRKRESAKAGQLHTDFNGMSSGMQVHVM